MPQTRAHWAIFLALIAPLPVRFAFFPLQSAIKILILAHDLCNFSLWSPISENDCMCHTCNFVDFWWLVLFRQAIFFQILLILKVAWLQNHAKGRSWTPNIAKQVPFGRSLLHATICKIHWQNVYFLNSTIGGRSQTHPDDVECRLCGINQSCAIPNTGPIPRSTKRSQWCLLPIIADCQ